MKYVKAIAGLSVNSHELIMGVHAIRGGTLPSYFNYISQFIDINISSRCQASNVVTCQPALFRGRVWQTPRTKTWRMEGGKEACILVVIIFVNGFLEIEGEALFFSDFLKFFNYENPVFIITDELDVEFSSTANDSGAASLISYTANKDEEHVADHLQNLYNLSEMTMIVFMDKGHQKLLDLLFNELQLFKKGLTGLVSEADINAGLNLTLRLDTKLYEYKSEGESISLQEAYVVNRKKRVQTVGTWTVSQGLTVPSANMWERRSNLEGMLVRVATVDWPLLHEIHYDHPGETVIGGGGFFIELFDILAKELNFTWE